MAIAAILLVPIPVTHMLDLHDYTNFVIRLTQALIYSWLIIHSVIISFKLIRTMRNKQYLYFQDHRLKIFLMVGGLLSFEFLNIAHVINQLTNGVSNVELSRSEFVLYFGFELLAIAVYSACKINEDLFLQLNRNRSIV